MASRRIELTLSWRVANCSRIGSSADSTSRSFDSNRREGMGARDESDGSVAEDEEDPRTILAQVRAAGRAMHPNLIQYARLHARARRRLPSASNRFVVWTCGCCGEPCSGFGNRMLGIVAALMLAILTERAFLIHWPEGACVPLSDYFTSDWIDWRIPPKMRSLISPAHQEYVVNWEPQTGCTLVSVDAFVCLSLSLRLYLCVSVCLRVTCFTVSL